jgi:hypothetical protein
MEDEDEAEDEAEDEDEDEEQEVDDFGLCEAHAARLVRRR